MFIWIFTGTTSSPFNLVDKVDMSDSMYKLSFRSKFSDNVSKMLHTGGSVLLTQPSKNKSIIFQVLPLMQNGSMVCKVQKVRYGVEEGAVMLYNDAVEYAIEFFAEI